MIFRNVANFAKGDDFNDTGCRDLDITYKPCHCSWTPLCGGVAAEDQAEVCAECEAPIPEVITAELASQRCAKASRWSAACMEVIPLAVWLVNPLACSLYYIRN